MDIKLTPKQQEYVDAYNVILNRINGIQLKIDKLKDEAAEALTELNRLRREEQLMFPENNTEETND
jgi:predicted ATP-grasp superfamily ATP-dependent carboligase